ncbi:hypothetical protein GCM10010451_59540 [Streptomyces virens]|uniref:Uncharacterized protein n=1 Tax=Streptomyces virens TaxID=285572 RepID=A0ABP6Q289_9ACTN
MRALTGLTGPVRALTGLTGPVRALTGLTGPVRALTGLTGPVRALTGLTGPVRALTHPACARVRRSCAGRAQVGRRLAESPYRSEHIQWGMMGPW